MCNLRLLFAEWVFTIQNYSKSVVKLQNFLTVWTQWPCRFSGNQNFGNIKNKYNFTGFCTKISEKIDAPALTVRKIHER